METWTHDKKTANAKYLLIATCTNVTVFKEVSLYSKHTECAFFSHFLAFYMACMACNRLLARLLY